MQADREASFLQSVCLPFLRQAQNTDGGWGFHTGSESRVEPTCWALLALIDSASLETFEARDAIVDGFRFLRAGQGSDGSWPSIPEEKTGSWVTSLACWTLLSQPEAAKAVGAGLSWLCNDWPRDSTVWRRFLNRLSFQHEVFPINTSYRGWGWTPHTSSWVEPTSLALLALEHAPAELLPKIAGRRRQLAEGLLYDRMCPRGGWNCGNPSVYGVAGEPLVGPTAWALLALRAHPQRPENTLSLDWLENSVRSIQGAGSLALARICLETYGRRWPEAAPKFSDFEKKDEFLENVQVVALVCLALNAQQHWLETTSVSTS
jgi:hypothetical protein